MYNNGLPEVLSRFPKERPPLPGAIEAIYDMHYKSNREGETTASSLAQKLESWMHRKVASTISESHDNKTLEIGAGTLNQLRYEPDVHIYDIIEPQSNLYKGSPFFQKIRTAYSDIEDIPAENRYDRITSVAALEHICNLPAVVARSGLLLTDDGIFCAGIPSEGGFLWGLAWRISTGLEFRLKYGLDYGILMRHEHVNIADEIAEIVTYFFTKVSCKLFGITKSLSLYMYLECKIPNTDRCRKYLCL